MPELLERWPAAVGPAIALNAWPARIAKDGTVHVNTADSVWAFELGQQAGEIAERLGVPRLRFAPGPLPEGDETPPPPVLEPTAEEDERARALATAITDEKLRESVQKAVRLSLARERRDRSV
jgi:Dna[CI] antecedent, DciA